MLTVDIKLWNLWINEIIKTIGRNVLAINIIINITFAHFISFDDTTNFHYAPHFISENIEVKRGKVSRRTPPMWKDWFRVRTSIFLTPNSNSPISCP